MRTKTLIGNWKMYKTVAQARAFAEEMGRNAAELPSSADYAICPPVTALQILRVTLPAKIGLGAQNIYFEAQGAFTGEVSAEMVKELGARYVIVGHSERRHVFGESDQWARQKVNAAVQEGLLPILCVGEDLRQRELDQTLSVVQKQTEFALQDLESAQVETALIAYEPVWAIGSGLTPTAEQAEQVIAHIRAVVRKVKGDSAAAAVRILYGGSVKPGNIYDFTKQPNIDGALVGGASLDATSFVEMAVRMAGGESA